MSEQKLIEAVRAMDHISIGGGRTRGGGEFSNTETGIIHYSPDELLISVKTGTTMEELEAVLDEHGQMLAQEPMDHRIILGTNGTPTIGGAIGLNADGPRRLRYGSLREAVLGLRFIDGEGEIIRAGGTVMKNVTGLDITKFFTGSRGQLGLALDVNFKLLPKPKETQASRFSLSAEDVQCKLLPLLRQPLEITGAVYHDGTLFLRQEGDHLAPLKKRVVDALGEGEVDDIAHWKALRDLAPMRDNDELWRIYLRPSQAILIAHAIGGDFMMLSGGSQILVAASASQIQPHLQAGMFAICEKGEARGQRLPEDKTINVQYKAKLKSVFDPLGKFGDQNAH